MKNNKITVLALFMGFSKAEVQKLQEMTEEGLLTEQEALIKIESGLSV